jgi:integrase
MLSDWDEVLLGDEELLKEMAEPHISTLLEAARQHIKRERCLGNLQPDLLRPEELVGETLIHAWQARHGRNERRPLKEWLLEMQKYVLQRFIEEEKKLHEPIAISLEAPLSRAAAYDDENEYWQWVEQPPRERWEAVESKTPEITAEQARALLRSIRPDSVVALRDRAIIGILIYTAARAGAVTKLTLKDLVRDGPVMSLRFREKGGKSREIPVRHDLARLIEEYLLASGLGDGPGHSPLFRAANRRAPQLTATPMTGVDLCRMVKRRLRGAGLPSRLTAHSFRVLTITDLLTHGATLEEVQHLAGHADPRTTRLYDRRPRAVTRNLVERITV